MTTSQFITHLVRMSNSTLTRTELLAVVNDCQNEILDLDTPLTRLRPDPVLPTTAATFAYDVDASTITAISTDGRLARRVRRAYVRANDTSNYNYGNNPEMYRTDGGTNAVGIGMFDAHPSLTESPNPVDSSANYPKVRFDEDDDPGTTTGTYYLVVYMWPTQLTSEAIALTIPDGHQRKVLQSRVLMELELMEYGRSIEWEQRFERQIKEFQSSMMKNETSDIDHVQFRDL